MRKMVMLIAALGLLGGCATMTKEVFIHESAGGHTFEKPYGEVLAEAKKILTERGYSFRESSEQAAIVTEWKEEMGNSTIAAAYTRYMVETYPLDGQHTRVRVMKNSSTAGSGVQPGSLSPSNDRSAGVVDGSGMTQVSNGQAAAREYANASASGRRTDNAALTRDLQFEWLLMQRLAPEEAKELQTVADDRFK